MVPKIGRLPGTVCTDKMLKRESNGKRSRKGVGGGGGEGWKRGRVLVLACDHEQII